MAAVNNTFVPIGGRNQIEIDANIVNQLYSSILNYTRSTIGDLMPTSDGVFPDRVITQWYLSEFSRPIRLRIQRLIGARLPQGIVDWEFTLRQFSNDDGDAFRWTSSISERGDTSEGGLLGLIKNVLRYISTINSDQLARTAGSDNGVNNAYTIQIRQIRSLDRALRDLEYDTTVKMSNNGKMKLYNPVLDGDLVYCGTKAIAYAMTKHGKARHIKDLTDEAVNCNKFVEIIKELIGQKKLLKQINVWRLESKGGMHCKKLLYPPKKCSKSEKLVEIVVGTDHVWLLETQEKKRRVDDAVECSSCGTSVEARHYRKHKQACDIRLSRKFDNLLQKSKEYPIQEYGHAQMERMEQETKDIFQLCLRVLRDEKSSVYLTGPGGNGKTHLIKQLCFNIPGEKWVCTPTGITADEFKEIGSTWQKRFKYTAFTGQRSLERLLGRPEEMKEAAKSILRQHWENKPRFIVFEECSMIRGLDFKFMSSVLSAFYDDERDFGGIPVMICGDPAQLPPVEKDKQCADLYFSCQEISRIRMHGQVVTMNHPRRLLQGGMDPIETFRQFNVQQEMRLGRLPEDFYRIVNSKFGDEFVSMCRNGTIERLNIVLMMLTHEDRKKVLDAMHSDKNVKKVGKNIHGHDLHVTVGMKMLVTDNHAVQSQRVYNGTTCHVVDYKANEWVLVRTQDGKQHRIKAGAGTNVYKGQFALDSYHVRTIHKAQGATFKGQVYFVAQCKELGINRYGKWSSGQMYTLFSRCTNMQNIHVVHDRNFTLRDCVQDKNCWTFTNVCDVIKDPKDVIGIDKMVGKDNQLVLRDTNSLTGFIQAKDRRIATQAGHHKDKYLMENERIHDNSLNIDHETRQEDVFGLRKHKVATVCPRWTLNGEYTDFREFLLRNGDDCEGLPIYKRRENGVMVFSMETMDDPQKGLNDYIFRIFKLVDKWLIMDVKLEKWPKEIRYIYEHPMIIYGFNNKRYDDFFLIQHAMMYNSFLTPEFVHAGGSILKQFMLNYTSCTKGRMACKTWDLLELSNPAPLSSHIKTSVKPFLGEPEKFMSIHSKMWITGIDPYGKHLLAEYTEDTDVWEEMSDLQKKKFIREFYIAECPWRHYQGSDRKADTKETADAMNRVDIFVKRCENAGKRDAEFLQDLKSFEKKGCTPLKLFHTADLQWMRENETVDLMTIMDDGNGGIDWTKAFFDREISGAKEMLQDRGENFFRNYPLFQEIEDYAVSDMYFNDLLLRIKDNTMGYWFGQDVEGVSMDEFKFGNSWAGLGLSMFNFDTTCQFTMQMAYTLMPDDCFYTCEDKSKFYTKFPVMPIDAGEIFNGICGGKTQARRAHFMSSDGGVKDYMTYLDVSGLYMKVQEMAEYGYGHISIWTNVHQKKLDEFMRKYEKGDKDLFERVRFFKIRGKCHEKEIENPVGVKTGQRLKYSNEEMVYYVANYNLEMLKLYDFEITEIITVIEFESQGKIMEKLMKYYAILKQEAEAKGDKNARALAKLLANAAFGAFNQKDKFTNMVAIRDGTDLNTIYDKYPSGIRNRRNMGDFMVGQVEKTEATSLYKPSYLGAITLDASKKTIYSQLYVAMGGRARLGDLKSMVGYGDTDSFMLTRECMERIIEHDKHVEMKDRILFDSSTLDEPKAGRLTNEPADDTEKYIGKDKVYHKSYPDFRSGFEPRILNFATPQSKSGFVDLIFPPTHWTDGRECTKDDFPEPDEQKWLPGYKCFIKGVDKQAKMWINGTNLQVDRIGFNKETRDLLWHSYAWNMPITSKRQDTKIKRVIFPNQVQQDEGWSPFDICNVEDLEKTVWYLPQNGRDVVMKEGYEGKTVQEWSRSGVNRFECSDGYSVPYGYKF